MDDPHYRFVVGSTNPIKVESVRSGLEQLISRHAFTLDEVDAASRVSSQPYGVEETRTGARNRAISAMRMRPNAHFWIGIEGGIIKDGARYHSFGYITVIDENFDPENHSDNDFGEAQSPTVTIPPRITKLLEQGYELGTANDIVFGEKNSKQNNGMVGRLTNDSITRSSFYTQAVVTAFSPFFNAELYEHQRTLERRHHARE